jgi:hypothetical protein
MMPSLRALALLFVTATIGLAQDTAGAQGRRVRGIVYDSISRAPLAGAVVEAAMVETTAARNPAAPALPDFTTVTDSAGQFEFAALPPGLYAVGFFHNVLNALGVESPITPLDLRTDTTAFLRLAVAGGTTVRTEACPGKAGDGLFAGYVTSARGGAPVPTASVTISWDQLDVGNGRLRASHQESKAAPDAGGRFNLCGIPREAPLQLRIAADGYRTVETELALPATGVFYHSFRLATADTAGGAGTIHLRVVDDSGRAMTTGRAMIVSLGKRAPIDSGKAAFAGLPSGTWVVDVRAIGYEPSTVFLDAEDETPAATTVRMDRMPFSLAPVSIVENANVAERKILDAISQRMLANGGSLILPDNLSLRNAIYASDGLRFARGFRVNGAEVQGRPYSQGISMRACTSKDYIPIGDRGIAVYLDGVRVPFGLQGVNDLVRPDEILAIEAYPDVISAPGIWKTNDACAVVAVWTRR